MCWWRELNPRPIAYQAIALDLLSYTNIPVTLPYFILTSDHIRTVSQNGVALVLGAVVYKLFSHVL